MYLYELIFWIAVSLIIISIPIALIWALLHINDASKGERFKNFMSEFSAGILGISAFFGIGCAGIIIFATKQLFISAIISLIVTYIIHVIDMKVSKKLRDSYSNIEQNYKDFFEIESGYSNLIICRNEKYDALSDAEKKVFDKNLDGYLKYKRLSSKRRLFFTDSFKGFATVFFIVFLIAVALQCQSDINMEYFNRFHE